MKKNLTKLSLVLILLLVAAGCKKHSSSEDIPDATGGKALFVSATSAGNYTSTELQAFATLKGFGTYAPLIKYDVNFFKIVYKTNYNGKQIEASGLIAIPQNTPTAPALLSAQHGTILSYAEAPSNFPNAFTGFELFASTGFITIIPDFIGYGSSKTVFPPYYDMGYSGSAVVDMIKATKYYLTTVKKSISSKLFLVGYSEGGYVTMAAQKQIETSADKNLVLTAAAEGAGGYDLNGMLTGIATVDSYPDPSFLALILNAYDITYSWNRPLTDFFSDSYASKIPALLNGSNTSDQINAQLTTSPAALFNSTFYAALTDATAETVLKAKLAANSFPNWYPKSPTRMYHGTADEDVFFQTSQTTYARFIAAGSTSLTFTPIPGGTHETSVIPMMLDVLPWFESLNQ